MRNDDGEEGSDGEGYGGQIEESTCARWTAGADEKGTSDGANAPCNIEQGEEACTCGGYGGAHDDVAGGEPGTQAKTNAEECDMGGAEVCPCHCGASDSGEDAAVDYAGAEIANGEPCSTELAGKGGGEERSGLGILNLPALDEGGEQRPQHYGYNTSYDEVEKYGSERTKGGWRWRLD